MKKSLPDASLKFTTCMALYFLLIIVVKYVLTYAIVKQNQGLFLWSAGFPLGIFRVLS